MNNISIGDFVVGNSTIWEIVSIEKSPTLTLYGIQNLPQPGDFLDDLSNNSQIMYVNHSHLRHLGEIVPKDSAKALEILFGKNVDKDTT